MTPGKSAALLVTEILRDLPGRKPSGATVLRWLSEGVRDLSLVGAFRRTEVVPVVAGQGEYALSQHAEKVLRVRYGGVRLRRASPDELDAERPSWMTDSGTPDRWTGDDRVRLTPVPSGAGTALAFAPAATSGLTEAEGLRLAGHDWCLARYAAPPAPPPQPADGSLFWFQDGDGRVPGALSSAGCLAIEYAFTPEDLGTLTVIPNRFLRALGEFARWKLLPAAEGERHETAYHAERALLAAQVVDPVYDHSHFKAAQTAIAEGKPLPKMLLDDYERIVHQAMAGGALDDKGFSLGTSFLLQAAQQAAAEGRPVPAVVMQALDTYVHDLDSYGKELQAAFSWEFCVDVVRKSAAQGLPVPQVVLAAYLRQQKAQTAYPRDLTDAEVTAKAARPPRISLKGECF